MVGSSLPVTFADVRAAQVALGPAVVRTPVAHSRTLSSITGAEVWIKFENLQYTGSFKERGARNRLVALDEAEKARGVIAVSAGNHAQAVAHHATLLGITSTVVMPEGTPPNKVARTEDNGAGVVLAGRSLADAREVARTLVEETGAVYVSPYDDALVIAGQGTCGIELVEDAPPLDVVMVPVGGGGLLAGIAVAVRGLAPEVELVGVQSAMYPAIATALGRDVSAVDPAWGPTIAEGIAVEAPGALTLPIISALADDVVAVAEDHIEEAIVWLLEIEKTVAEGAGAAGLAALLADRDRFRGRRVGLVLSGGNIDLRLLSSVIMRGLARTGRLSRFVVEVADSPGALGRLTAAVGQAGGNIVDVEHQREFGRHSARVTEVELLVETRDASHARRVATTLGAEGYVIRPV